MKIAIIHPDMTIIGGAENVIIWLALDLVRKGHKVDIFSKKFNKSKFIYLQEKGVGTKKIGSCCLNNPFIKSKLFISLFLSYRLKKYNIINVHNYPATQWIYQVKKIFKIKLKKTIWFCHEPPRLIWFEEFGDNKIVKNRKKIEKMKIIDKKVVSVFDEIYTNSPYTSKIINKIYGIKVKRDVLGIPLDKYNINKNIKICKNANFGIISRIEKIKNIDILLDTIKIIQNKFKRKDIKLIIGGNGSYKNEIEKRINKEKIKNTVLKGYVPEIKIDDFYDNLKIVTFFPLNEPLGLITLEAGARGKVVLASNSGGPAYIIDNNVTGFLIDPNNAEAIAKKIIEIIDDDKKLISIGFKARENIFKKFNFKNFTEDFLK